MRALIRSMFILIVVLSVLLMVIIGVTYRDTNHFAYLFTNPDGSKCMTPCLMGSKESTYKFESTLPTVGDLLVALGKPEEVATNRTLVTVDPLITHCYDIVFVIQGYSYRLLPLRNEGLCLRFDQKILSIELYHSELARPVKWDGFVPDDYSYIILSNQWCKLKES